MHIDAALLAFMNAVHSQDRDKVLNIITDQQWRQEVEQLDANGKHALIEKCKKDAQYAYEFLTMLRLLEDPSVTLDKNEKKHISTIKEALHKIVDSSNIDIDLINLNFISNSSKPKQSMLGKARKEGKKYPTLPTSALITMNPEFWNLDAKVPYLDSAKAEKKGLKIQLNNGKITRGQQKEAIEGEFLYVLSPKGGLYAIKEKGTQKKHSSFRAGQPVISAGHMHVKDGKITKIDSISGHYTPPPKQTLLACLILKEQNMIDDNCIVHLYGYSAQPLGVILQERSYASLVEACRETLSIERMPEPKAKMNIEQKVVDKVVERDVVQKPTSSPVRAALLEKVKACETRKGYRPALDVLNYLENPDVLESVAGKGATIIDFDPVKLTGGGTQSQRYRFTLNDGRVLFLKQTVTKSHIDTQREADKRIKQALGAYADEGPFPFMLRGEDFGQSKGIAIFPNVDGYMLFESFKRGKQLSDRNPESYKRISAALSKVHISGMLNQGQLEAFYATDCDLRGKNILYHDDFQASNIMLTNRGEVYFVDTDAVEVSEGKEYKNLFELIDLNRDNPDFVRATLEGYLSNFDKNKQDKVLTSIQKNLSEKHKYEIPLDALPTLPVEKLEPIVENIKPDKPVTKERAKAQEAKQRQQQEETRRNEAVIRQQQQEEAKRQAALKRQQQQEEAKRQATIKRQQQEEAKRQEAKRKEKLISPEKAQPKVAKQPNPQIEGAEQEISAPSRGDIMQRRQLFENMAKQKANVHPLKSEPRPKQVPRKAQSKDIQEPLAPTTLPLPQTQIPAKPDPVLADLSLAQKQMLNQMLEKFGATHNEIFKRLQTQYQDEKSKIKGKGLLHKFGRKNAGIALKREKQLADLATLFSRLQNENGLTAHEKGILLMGGLQSVIDNIVRTEANSPYQSGLLVLCHHLMHDLKDQNKVGMPRVDHSEVKLLYNVYRSTDEAKNPVQKMRDLMKKQPNEAVGLKKQM